MALTIDSRPTSIGDMVILTGTFDAGDTNLDFSTHVRKIFSFNMYPTNLNTGSPITMSTKTININDQDTVATVALATGDFAVRSGDVVDGILQENVIKIFGEITNHAVAKYNYRYTLIGRR